MVARPCRRDKTGTKIRADIVLSFAPRDDYVSYVKAQIHKGPRYRKMFGSVTVAMQYGSHVYKYQQIKVVTWIAHAQLSQLYHTLELMFKIVPIENMMLYLVPEFSYSALQR